MNERDYHDHHYGGDAERILHSAIFQRVHERAARGFLRCTGSGRAHRILSLGCGEGSIERRLAPHVGEIVGVDISPVAIGQARAAARAGGLANVTFLVDDPGNGSLEHLGEFHVVAAFAFLHHLADAAIERTLASSKRVLRPNGLFYSADPSRRRLVRLFAAFVRPAYERYHSPDERELDPGALAKLAGAAGYSTPAIGYTDYFLGPLAWLAPGTPRWLAAGLQLADSALLNLPFARRFASTFSLCARA